MSEPTKILPKRKKRFHGKYTEYDTKYICNHDGKCFEREIVDLAEYNIKVKKELGNNLKSKSIIVHASGPIQRSNNGYNDIICFGVFCENLDVEYELDWNNLINDDNEYKQFCMKNYKEFTQKNMNKNAYNNGMNMHTCILCIIYIL